MNNFDKEGFDYPFAPTPDYERKPPLKHKINLRWLRRLLFKHFKRCPICLRKLYDDYETHGGHPMGEKIWYQVCPSEECEFNEDVVEWLFEGIFKLKTKKTKKHLLE